MKTLLRGLLSMLILLGIGIPISGVPQVIKDVPKGSMILIANPHFRDPEYLQTVVAVWPYSGGHIGVIVNRPTNAPLSKLFPEHEPSKMVEEPVFSGGPFGRNLLITIVKAENPPGEQSVNLESGLYLTAVAEEVDKVIETTPNEARYFIGFVVWNPGQLQQECTDNLWLINQVGQNQSVIFDKRVIGQDAVNLWLGMLLELLKEEIKRRNTT